MRKKLGILICSLLLALGAAGFFMIKESIPDTLNVAPGREEIHLHLPMVEQEAVTAGGGQPSNIPEGQAKISCSLLGIIPIKDIHVNMVEERKLTPGGCAIGIYMKTKGILVVGTGIVQGMNGLDYEPALDIVQSGDYITAVNGKVVSKKEELTELVNASKGSEVVLDIQREEEKVSLKLSPVHTGKEEYKLGIWVRDDTQGIGTLTYLDEQMHFGALGHGISDVDTGGLLDLEGGILYHTDILSITRGERGVPGELSGVIRYQPEEKLGEIEANTNEGIFGSANERLAAETAGNEPLPIAYRQEVQPGQAQILCAPDGTVRAYQAQIEKTYLNSHDANKSIVIRITDPELLAQTGGIVQGLSGSPILQDGKLVGAVTHVFVNDPESGYGIFIEDMLEH